MEKHNILNKLPKAELGFFPTPIVTLKNLSRHLGGPEILMKRDDLTGLALGGNKTRKLAFIIGDALQKGCDTVVTAGAQQSNHCRQTAAAAAQLGLECHLLLGGTLPNDINGNLLLDQLLGAHIHWTNQNRKGEDIPQVVAALKNQGKKPYVIPYGGSNALGACGFVSAGIELETQLKNIEISDVFFASSSGGTHAGLMLAKTVLDAQYNLVGVQIDKDEDHDSAFKTQVTKLANETSVLLGMDIVYKQSDVLLEDGFLGEGYGVVGAAEQYAINLLARTEGILLDPVYTGRAMAALIDKVQKGGFDKSQRVLFWHTGGAPSLFSYASKVQ
ncbi:D-cysteine desulfhydrase family protein [Pseudoalteromonas sp. SMS1]|uniref:D-cysteine desulfhydrase family protein n=1 Tax=Pseudoalteromonas sp. SMS1 TaxID=2908894 RepID=UPI001F33D6E6|nr:D-cysteine desulfhydrase family protein [Pseudoalteromonas sp. SMS1]MCF2859489.1 D-cysteine desulfhydrase family protein [Pseudoalteromonas sp. SMS1]